MGMGEEKGGEEFMADFVSETKTMDFMFMPCGSNI
jgi:hypothetical protein